MIPSPDPNTSIWAWILLGPVLVLGLFIPGHVVFSRLRSPLPWLTAFLGSCLILFFGVLLLDLTSLRINLFTLGALLTLITLIGWRLRLPNTSFLPPLSITGTKFGWRSAVPEWWWILPASIAFISMLAHAVFEPLSGFDNFFRWNHLALLMEAQGSIAHYPPVTAIDFQYYPWCDGIPALVPMINLWVYLGTSSTAETLIVGRLVVELALTLGLVWHLARRLWGTRGAKLAVLSLSTSTLFLWSMGIEQETGLSGIAYLAIAALLLHYRDTPSLSNAVWVALAAAFGALCRDYHLILIPFALVGLIFAKAPRLHLVYALGSATLTAAPWYLRNAWLTGNPLFPHDLGGLFATNPVHHEFMLAIQIAYSLEHPGIRLNLLYGFITGAGVLFLLALPGLVVRRFETRLIALLVLIAFTLFLIAVPSTAGGPIYALRVLGTALPLFAVAAGRCAEWLSPRSLLILGLCLLPLSADAARRSWTFVWSPYQSPWPYSWTFWRGVNEYVQGDRHSPIWHHLSEIAQGESLVVLDPNRQILLGRAGGYPIPIFSPEVQVLTDTSGAIRFPEAIAELRQRRVRFVILSDDHLQSILFIKSHPLINQMHAMPPTVKIQGLRLYDLILIARDLNQPAP